MTRTADEWMDMYYEQQALHTESNGMLCQERDAMQRRAEAAEADMVAATAYAEERATLLRRVRDEVNQCGELSSATMCAIDAALAKEPK